MGTFLGHVVPGSFFLLFGFWYNFQIFQRYFLCQRAAHAAGPKSRSRYCNTSSFRCACCPNVPLEGILKICAVIVGMTGEFATAFKDGKFTYLGNAQHMTMFFFFGVNGVMDVLNHYRVPVPPDMDFVSAILAFSMEGLLFFYHLHGRSHMDIQVHMLLFYVVMACAASTILEMCYKKNVLPALCRAYFVILQGSWFYQIGFILYPPIGGEWDQHDHNQMMIVTLLFTWHNAAIFVLMALSCTLIYLKVKVLTPTQVYRLLHPHGYHLERFSKLDQEQIKNIIVESEEEEQEI